MMQWLAATLVFLGAGFLVQVAARGVFSSRRGAQDAFLFFVSALAIVSLICIGLVAFAGIFPSRVVVLAAFGLLVTAGVGLELVRRIGAQRFHALTSKVVGWLTRPVGGKEE